MSAGKITPPLPSMLAQSVSRHQHPGHTAVMEAHSLFHPLFLTRPKTSQQSVERNSSSIASDLENASSSSNSSCTMTGDLAHETGEGAVLRLRGLPFNCDTEAVRNFFQPTELAEVYFCRRDGACSCGCHSVEVVNIGWDRRGLTPAGSKAPGVPAQAGHHHPAARRWCSSP